MTFLGKGARGRTEGEATPLLGVHPFWRSACFHLTVALSFHGDQAKSQEQQGGPHSLKVGSAEACGRPPKTAR